MKTLLSLVAALCIGTSAAAASPSAESIDKLFEVTDVQKMLVAMRQQVDSLAKASIEGALKGETLSAPSSATSSTRTNARLSNGSRSCSRNARDSSRPSTSWP